MNKMDKLAKLFTSCSVAAKEIKPANVTTVMSSSHNTVELKNFERDLYRSYRRQKER